MVECSLQLLTTLIKQCKLLGRERIEGIIITTYKMREHTSWYDGILMFQSCYQFFHIIFQIKAQTVHTSIQFDMYRETSNTFFFCSLDQRIQNTERINLWFQIIVEHGLEGCHLRIHNHDIARNTILAKRNTLIGYCYGKIIHTMILQCLGDFYRSCSITIRLDHAYQLGLWFHERTVIVQIGHYCIQIYLQSGFMHLFHEQLCELVKAKLTGTLQQDDLIAQGGEHLTLDKVLNITEEEFL